MFKLSFNFKAFLRILTISYFTLPSLLFLLTWVTFPVSSICSISLIFLIYKAIINIEKNELNNYSINFFNLGITLLISLLITILFGIGEFNHQTLDFINNNFKYHDLSVYQWPVYYKEYDSYLCYYTAYYLPISFLCKITELEYGRFYSLIWNWVGIGLSLLWIIIITPKRAGLVIFFILLYNDSWFVIRILRNLGVSNHLPPNYISLNGYQLVFMAPFSDQIAWAPQHVLPGIIGSWLFLFVHNNYTNKKFLELFIFWMSSMFWSPFATVGLAPFIILLTWKYRTELFEDIPTIRYILIVVLSFSPIIIYLISTQATSNNGTNMFIWQTGIYEWPAYYLLYIFSNFIIWIFFLRKNISPKHVTILWVTLITLCILPLYRIGIYNDLQMRANVPSLCILGLFISQQLANKALSRNWISITASILFLINSISVFKFYLSFFPIDNPINSIEKPFLNGCYNTPEFLSKTYGGPQAAKQYMMKKNSFFQEYLLKKELKFSK